VPSKVSFSHYITFLVWHWPAHNQQGNWLQHPEQCALISLPENASSGVEATQSLHINPPSPPTWPFLSSQSSLSPCQCWHSLWMTLPSLDLTQLPLSTCQRHTTICPVTQSQRQISFNSCPHHILLFMFSSLLLLIHGHFMIYVMCWMKVYYCACAHVGLNN
jgi:hypothetical protein